MSLTLKPCPFCGSPGRAWAQAKGASVVGCESGSHTCPVQPHVYGVNEDATAAWNRRQEGAGDWRPIETAPKDGTYVLARVASPPHGKEGRWAYLGGRHFVIRHEGKTPSGYDLGWTLHPGFGGCSDAWFDGWLPLAPPPSSQEGGD